MKVETPSQSVISNGSLYIYMGHFMGDLQSKIFFRRNIFFCILTSKIIDTFFFQCDTSKFRDIILLSLALGKIFFFLTAYCKSSFEFKM